MGNVATGLPIVAESLSLVCTRLRDREYSSVRFGHREQHAILETSESKVSAEGNVAASPEHVGIEGKDATRPLLVSPDRSLEFKLVDVEEKPVMLGLAMRRLPSVGRRQNDVAEPD
ncbi:MAG: hypothetical protein E6I66_08845 [Chloroflexi bacterium]|nr:MAG: hypothetical protein E6I66_08845 [Chloroflexota bacterium]